MFCNECGHEIPEGAQFCGECGAPVPGATRSVQADAEKNVAPVHPRRRTAAIAALSVLSLAVVAVAVYVIYALVLEPTPAADPVTDDALETMQNADDGDAADTDALSVTSEPEPEPEPEPDPDRDPDPAPAPAHDFECEYFYLDVPDSWVLSDGASPELGGPTLWYAEPRGDGTYYFAQSTAFSAGDYVEYETGACTVIVGSGAGGATYFGSTSDGTPVYVAEASAGFLYHGYDFEVPSECAHLTLK